MKTAENACCSNNIIYFIECNIYSLMQPRDVIEINQ